MRFLKIGSFHTLRVCNKTLPIVRASYVFWEIITRCDPIAHAWAKFCLDRLPPSKSSKQAKPQLGKANPGFVWDLPEVLEFYESLTPRYEDALDFACRRYNLTREEIAHFQNFLAENSQPSGAAIVDHPVLRAIAERDHSL